MLSSLLLTPSIFDITEKKAFFGGHCCLTRAVDMGSKEQCWLWCRPFFALGVAILLLFICRVTVLERVKGCKNGYKNTFYFIRGGVYIYDM
jgi:hypothetical protein